MKPLAFISITTLSTVLSAIASLLSTQPAKAETLASFCGYLPDSVMQAPLLEPCLFSWEANVVEIEWKNGIHTRFEPVEGESNLYTDQRGSMVYAQRSHVGADAQFRLENGTVLVYLRRAQQPPEPDG